MLPVAPSWLGQDVKHSTEVVATRASIDDKQFLHLGGKN